MSAPNQAQVLELLRQYGWNATSFQSLEAGFKYWFAPNGCVAYVDTGSAWVAAGAPIAPENRLAEVTQGFMAAASAAGRRCHFFGAESRLVEAAALASMPIGEQPVWDPTRWDAVLASSRSLREQLRRARAKGVTIALAGPDELAPNMPLRLAVETLIARWQSAHTLAPMGFLVDVQPFHFAEERRYLLAMQGGRVVGFLAAVPIYARRGWLLEDFLREKSAPNGTMELLVDAAMRNLAAEGSHYVTMGLAPLSGSVTQWLRAVRRVARSLYDFAGLRAFKARLRPHEWHPIYLAHAPGTSSHVALYDALAAFARGSFLRFGGETLLRGPAVVVRLLAALLVPWTGLLALAPVEWFPSPAVKWGWVGFDVLVAVALFALAHRWRHWLGVLIAGAVTTDAVLTLTEIALWNGPGAHGPTWPWLLASSAAPIVASVVLWGATGHRRTAAQLAQVPDPPET